MRLVNNHLATKVRLTEPSDNGFLVVAAEVGDWAGPFPKPSHERRRLLTRVVTLCASLAVDADVVEVVVFRAALRPPGEGAEILRRNGVRPARYDVVVLVRTTTVKALDTIRANAAYRELVAVMENAARHTHVIAADNRARIADVDHGPNHWFLFNYFHCDDAQTVYDTWEYTAGWFQNNTALPDSTLMRPLPGEPTDYGVLNHASWPNLRTFLPKLLLQPCFRSFVLANFKANGVAAQPILYRRRSTAALPSTSSSTSRAISPR